MLYMPLGKRELKSAKGRGATNNAKSHARRVVEERALNC
jgi:hypothetical protein